MKELSALRRTECPVKAGLGVRNRRNTQSAGKVKALLIL